MLHGKQVSSWHLDRTDTAIDCTTRSVGNGSERWTFATPRPATLIAEAFRHTHVVFTSGTRGAEGIWTRGAVTRQSKLTVIPHGPCATQAPGLPQPKPPVPDCGTRTFDNFGFDIENPDGAKNWVALIDAPPAPFDPFRQCIPVGPAFPDLLPDYTNGEPITTQLPKSELFNPAVPTIVVHAGGWHRSVDNGAHTQTWLNWTLTLTRVRARSR
jgi:hypothetical protein